MNQLGALESNPDLKQDKDKTVNNVKHVRFEYFDKLHTPFTMHMALMFGARFEYFDKWRIGLNG